MAINRTEYQNMFIFVVGPYIKYYNVIYYNNNKLNNSTLRVLLIHEIKLLYEK
jgi:hypothetical protein